jgi:hypothetical protein
MKLPNYEIILIHPALIIIEDKGPHDEYLTVTNGAELVVQQLASQLGRRKLYYLDSDKVLTQILVKDGKMAGFRLAD